jgi:hypothetical protein
MEIDHLVIAGATIEEASSFVEKTLGLELEPGGKHQRYSTHNRLLKLDHKIYIEVIAIDPDVDKPKTSRWFNLDKFSGAPRIINWVCRCDNLTKILNGFPKSVGEIISMERGFLTWDITVSITGVLPFGGAHPSIIQWKKKVHPTSQLLEHNLSLDFLEITHPNAEELKTYLNSFSDSRIRIKQGSHVNFLAKINTPAGAKFLS